MALILEVRCDECDRCGDSANPKLRPGHIMRRELRARGWRQENARDLCPGCVEEKKHRKRVE